MSLRKRVLALLPLIALALPLAAEQPANEDLRKIQEQAEQLKAQADACARMKCPVVDCASLAATMQALIDAETILDALHNALLDQDAAMRDAYNNAASNAHLTGTKLAQLQDSLAWQEYFHKIGNYLLKIASISNTLNDIATGKFTIDGDKGALDALDRLDSLGNLLKNTGDLTTDLAGGLAHGGEVPPTSDAKGLVNLGSDLKSEAVDVAKVARDAREAYKDGGGAQDVANAIKNSRNLLSFVGRTLKLYSEWKIKQEKAVLKELTATEGPEAEAVKRAYEEWQRVRERKFAAADALAAVRQAKDALAACMAKAGCGAKTLSRPPLPAYQSYGEALRDLEGRLPALGKRLAAGIAVADKCPEPGTTPQPPKGGASTPQPPKEGTSTPQPPKGGTSTTPLPPPRHVVENNCPQCADIALELARTLDEMEFDGQELHRIRANLEKAQDLEKDAEILRNAIKRITDLAIEFRSGKSDRNALQRAGDALFRALGKASSQIDDETLEREKRDRQNKLHDVEERIAALKAEEGRIPALEKDQMRLYELSEKLKIRLAECQRRCAPTPTPTPVTRTSTGPAPTPRKPVKTGKIRIALLYPADAQPGEQFCGKVVDNPQDWKSSPLVRVAEFEVSLPLDGAGKPLLERTFVSFDRGPVQPADGPVTCQVPRSGTTTVSVRTSDSPTPAGETQVTCPATPQAPVVPSVPQVCVKDYLFSVQAPSSADPKTARVTISEKPATLVTGTPRGWNCLVPADVAPGAATVVYEETGRRMSAKTAVLALILGADKTNLLRGESTAYSTKVLGLGAIPESAWTTPYSPDPTARAILAGAAPGMAPREGEPGKILLVIENRSPETISIDGEKAGRIVLTIDRAAVTNGTFDYKGTIRSKKAGGFNIRATVIPLLAPVPLRAEP